MRNISSKNEKYIEHKWEIYRAKIKNISSKNEKYISKNEKYIKQKWFTNTERLNAFSTRLRRGPNLDNCSQSDNFLLSPWQKDSATVKDLWQGKEFSLKTRFGCFAFQNGRSIWSMSTKLCNTKEQWEWKYKNGNEKDFFQGSQIGQGSTYSVGAFNQKWLKSFLFLHAPHLNIIHTNKNHVLDQTQRKECSNNVVKVMKYDADVDAIGGIGGVGAIDGG